MQEYQNTSPGQNVRRKKERQATSPEATSQPRGHAQHMLHLQRTFGNRKVGQFLQAKRLTSQGMLLGLQRKLTVGAADDQYEQEADRVARQVTNTSDAAVAQSLQRAMTPAEDKEEKIQTKPVATSITPFVQRQGQDEERDESIQSKSTESLSDSFEAGADVEMQLSQSKGQGSPLPDSVRTYMEPRFGADFSHVRAHTGSAAVQMNRDVGAQAFTHGADIYYGEGRSPTNLALTAHELTHVVQQTGSLQNKPIARRWVVQRAAEDVAQMDGELQACLAAEPFDRMRAAEILNGFNREDIQARLKPLSNERIAEIHQGAVENPVLGPASQVALLTQSVHAEVTRGDTGAGGAGPVPSGPDGTGGARGSSSTPPETETGTEVAGPVPTPEVGGTSGAPGREHGGTEGVPGVEVTDDIDVEEARQMVHSVLDVIGLIPVVDVFADGANVALYATEGDWINAGISVAAMIPVLGIGATVAKNVLKIEKATVKKLGKEGIEEAIQTGRRAVMKQFLKHRLGPAHLPTQPDLDKLLAEAWSRLGGNPTKLPKINIDPTLAAQNIAGTFRRSIGEIGIAARTMTRGELTETVYHEAWHALFAERFPNLVNHAVWGPLTVYVDEIIAYGIGGAMRVVRGGNIADRLAGLAEAVLPFLAAHGSINNWKEAVPFVIQDMILFVLYMKWLCSIAHIDLGKLLKNQQGTPDAIHPGTVPSAP